MTTFVQMIVIVIGLVWVSWIAGDMAGGFDNVIAKAAAEGKFEFLPALDAVEIVAWIAAFATMHSALSRSRTCSSA